MYRARKFTDVCDIQPRVPMALERARNHCDVHRTVPVVIVGNGDPKLPFATHCCLTSTLTGARGTVNE